MTDAGVAYSDKELARLERKLKSIYGQAEKDIAEKMESFERNYVKKDALYREKVRNGEMSKDEYDYWKRGQVFQGNLWQQKKDQMAEAVYQANVNASNLINGSTIKVFTENANYASYMMEKGVGINFGFTLYDENTVSNLIKNEPDLLVQYKPKKGIDKAWNRRKITNQVTQGIIQGESIPKIAKRLSQVTGSQNMKSMMMHARTSVTNAQNAGRIQSYRNAQSLGINVKKEWLATLDGRTRDQHGRLDGQKVDLDKPFVVDGFEIQYPGDPTAKPALVYNCRCTLVADIVDYPSQYKGYTDIDGKFVGAMSYDEWKNGKKKESAQPTITSVMDITSFSGMRDYFKNKFDINVIDAVDNLEFEQVREAMSGIESVLNEFPEVVDTVQNIGVMPGGYMCSNGKNIYFNPNHFAMGGHWDSNEAFQAGAHEAGHCVDMLMCRIQEAKSYGADWYVQDERWHSSRLSITVDATDSWYHNKYANKIVQKAGRNLKKENPAYSSMKSVDFRHAVSNYSLKDTAETLADAVGNEMLLKSKGVNLHRKKEIGHEFGQEIMRLLKEEVKRHD